MRKNVFVWKDGKIVNKIVVEDEPTSEEEIANVDGIFIEERPDIDIGDSVELDVVEAGEKDFFEKLRSMKDIVIKQITKPQKAETTKDNSNEVVEGGNEM